MGRLSINAYTATLNCFNQFRGAFASSSEALTVRGNSTDFNSNKNKLQLMFISTLTAYNTVYC